MITLKYANRASIVRAIEEIRPDVLHFVGHGVIDRHGGALILESDKRATEARISAGELAGCLYLAKTQLVILSGCFTGGVVASVGAQLSKAGIAAVVGMQMPIKDSSAHLFSRAMYAALQEGASLGEATSQGRKAIAGTGVDWVAPVLMCDDASSVLFPRKGVGQQIVTVKHNLPSDARPFVGRKSELAALRKHLTTGSNRLVTITGIGGIGKTRLGLQFATEAVDAFDDGVWHVACDPLRSRADVVTALAEVLEIAPEDRSEASLIEYLRPKRMLILFDCFEHLIHCQSLPSDLLSHCPQLRILVTSRVVLGCPCEFEFSVAPMSVARRSASIPEAVELFLGTATKADLKRIPRKAIVNLVRELEAVPLAIVLAASRLRHMSFEELTERVRRQRLQVVARRPQSANDKHANLLRVVADSLALLDAPTRNCLVDLTAFVGGFHLSDAEIVLSHHANVLDEVAMLRDHSLLSCSVVNGRMRYRCLDTIREAVDHLNPGARDSTVVAKHAIHFADIAQGLSHHVEVGNTRMANQAMWLDLSNFRAAIKTATELHDHEALCKLSSSLARLMYEAALLEDFKLLSRVGLDAAIATDRTSIQVELLGLMGSACRREGDLEGAKRHWLRRSQLCARAGLMTIEADTLLDLADLAVEVKSYSDLIERLIRFDQITDLPLKLIICRRIVEANALLQQARNEEAARLAELAAEQARGVPASEQAFFVWTRLSKVFLQLGNPGISADICAEMLREAVRRDYAYGAARALLDLATCRRMQSDARAAAQAIAVVASIERNLPKAVLTELKVVREELESHHPHLLADVESTMIGSWTESALAICA